MSPITALLSVTLETPNLDKSLDFYTTAFGLNLLNANDRGADLAGAGSHTPALSLRDGSARRLTSLTFELEASRSLSDHAADLRARGLDTTEEDGALTAIDADQHRLSFVLAKDRPLQPATGHPLYLSHAVINTPDPQRSIDFYVQRLGFTVSDAYEQGLLTFLRCAQRQHHCIAIAKAAHKGVHHVSWECGSIDAVMQSVTRMRGFGMEPLWGPGRHGPGGNIFCYFADPDGLVVEFTTDLIQINDDDAWIVREWARTPLNADIWGGSGPSPRAIALFSGAP
ncbi:MAG: VOC family protein [Hyphomonadaceae bacterium]